MYLFICKFLKLVMIPLQKLRVGSFLKWVFFNSAENPRFYGKKTFETGKVGIFNKRAEIGKGKLVNTGLNAVVEAALHEYLYYTRNIQFSIAENMSKNSPNFVKNLLEKIQDDEDVGRRLRLLFRYHPINEFEPFFESLGLQPWEYTPLLPRNTVFLSDDALLVENYHVLCFYGVAPQKIGKICLEAREVLRYDYGVLKSKLLGYEKLGLSQTVVAKVIVYNPGLLVGDVNADFVEVLDRLMRLGIEFGWMEEHLLGITDWNWAKILELLHLFSRIGLSKEQLGGLISQHPGFLLEGSGYWTLLLIGFLLKFGCTMNQIHLLFLQFPQIHVEKFVSNLRQSFRFFHSIDMDSEEIHNIVRSYPLLLGSCQLKKSPKLLNYLKVSKQRLCSYIKENPLELKKWVLHSVPGLLPESEEEKIEETQKAKFMSNLGIENFHKSKGRIYKRTKLKDLQERFDTFVKAGLDPEDVAKIVKRYPTVLCRSKDGIQRKIDYLVNCLGYPISTLLTCPNYILMSTATVKLKMSMYNWLKDEGAVSAKRSVSTILGTSDKAFITGYVTRHPRGLEVWEDMKKHIYMV